MNKLLCCVLTVLFGVVFGGVGERCTQNGAEGVIRLVRQCESVLKNSGILKSLRIYGLDGHEPLICCGEIEVSPLHAVSTTPPVATTPKLGSSTTEYVPEEYEYHTNEPVDDSCAPLTATVAKTGRKAWDKCVEYQEQLVFPCELSVAILGGMARYNHCQHGDKPAMGYANRDQYPHMAQLGYRSKNSSISWRCSGTLLSERFILTAAQCQFGQKFGAVGYAMVGSMNGPENVDRPQTHRIRRVIRHPLYKKRSLYHDIALAETETKILLDQWTVPACLDVFRGDDSKAIATSWISGADMFYAEPLAKLNRRQCKQRLRFTGRANRRLRHGYDAVTQACYGSHQATDPNQIKSRGGPVAITNKMVACMYDVVGVTSYKRVRRSFTTAIVTRVQYYVPWIESVVWP